MAYRFGQFRREQYSRYVDPIDNNHYTLGSVVSEIEGFSGQKVKDIILKRPFKKEDGSLFLRFALTRFDRETGVTIKLAKENTSALATDNIQTIAKITIPAYIRGLNETTPLIYDIIISPNDDYAQLVFAIDRDGRDLIETPRAWKEGVSFMVQEFGQIQNLLSNSNPIDTEGLNKLRQVGVQSRPGLEMCINGEMIRVGRSGIYEINHGVEITFLGFMPSDKDHFILDYQY